MSGGLRLGSGLLHVITAQVEEGFYRERLD